MNIVLYLSLFCILLIITRQSDDEYFLSLKSKNSSICDLKITTDNFVIFSKCELSEEWKLYYEKTTSQNSLDVYENKETPIRVINFEYIMDNSKSQPDIKITNIEIKSFFNEIFIKNMNISNQFPILLKKGDNFDVIIEYGNMNYTYINLVINIFMKSDIDSTLAELNFGYSKILFNEYYQKLNLSYLFLVIFFIFFIFLLRLKFLIEENQFIKIHLDEIIQGKNAEKIFVAIGVIITILLFFMIIKYIYYITFIFSILLAIISVKSFYKYLFKIVIPSLYALLEDKYLLIKNYKMEYSNIIFYPLSAITMVFWYYISDDKFYLHTFLNDIIFFTIVYFNVHKLNLKNFFIITAISFFVIIYQVIKIVLNEDNIQKDKNNVYYITTRAIIDVPIRFILKDFLESPFEEIYFFSIIDILLIGYIIHYCDAATKYLSNIYLIISIYGTILGLIINMILFYGFKFSPPMSLIPLFICIVALIIYSVHKKQFFDFMDLEKNENQEEIQDIVNIQEFQEHQNSRLEKFELSFKNLTDDKIFTGETDNLKIKEKEEDEEEENDDEKRKKYMNDFLLKLEKDNKSTQNLLGRNSIFQQDDFENRINRKSRNSFQSDLLLSPKEKNNTSEKNNKDKKNIEMEIFKKNENENNNNNNDNNNIENEGKK